MKKAGARQLGISWNFLGRSDQNVHYWKKRADALDDIAWEKVISFYVEVNQVTSPDDAKCTASNKERPTSERLRREIECCNAFVSNV